MPLSGRCSTSRHCADLRSLALTSKSSRRSDLLLWTLSRLGQLVFTSSWKSCVHVQCHEIHRIDSKPAYPSPGIARRGRSQKAEMGLYPFSKWDRLELFRTGSSYLVTHQNRGESLGLSMSRSVFSSWVGPILGKTQHATRSSLSGLICGVLSLYLGDDR